MCCPRPNRWPSPSCCRLWRRCWSSWDRLCLSKSPAVVEEDAVDALALRVKRVAVQCGLSPREQEVLAIWATGPHGAYIEKQLFISKNTVKTHLNHIYAKTKTANRGGAVGELLESVGAG